MWNKRVIAVDVHSDYQSLITKNGRTILWTTNIVDDNIVDEQYCGQQTYSSISGGPKKSRFGANNWPPINSCGNFNRSN